MSMNNVEGMDQGHHSLIDKLGEPKMNSFSLQIVVLQVVTTVDTMTAPLTEAETKNLSKKIPVAPLL